MNGTHQVLAYVDDVIVIGDDIRTIERSEYVLLNYMGVVVSTEKTKYMEVGRHRGLIANEHIIVRSNLYEKVKTF